MNTDLSEGDTQPIAELLFQAIFRRPCDPAGAEAVRNDLARGNSLTDIIRSMMQSDEFRSTAPSRNASLSSTYDPAADDQLSRYLTREVVARSEFLRSSTPFSPEAFDAAAEHAVHRMQIEASGMGHQEEYLRFHRDRFFELNSLAATSVAERSIADAQIADVGFSTNSMLLQFLLPKTRVSIIDRFPGEKAPPSLKGQYFHADLTAQDLENLDLDIRADVILFAEVLEHLTANPVRVLSFLIRHLAHDGRLVVTTPNFFRREVLSKIAERNNPQFTLPIAATPNDMPHFHVREYGMKELLGFAEQAGGKVEAFFYSSCWDDPETRDVVPPDQLSNMVVVITRAN